MTNPIAHPLVDNPMSPDLDGLVSIDAGAPGTVTVSVNGAFMNSEVAAALTEAFETLHGADHVRVVFLRGAFSGRPDRDWLKTEAEDWDESDLRDDAMIVARMLVALTHVPALTVALVEGEASGEGAGLVAACDMAVAAADATFAFREVKSGAVPSVVAPYVVNAVGPRQAKALFMTGRAFDADYALQIGLVSQVVAAGGVSAVAAEVAAEALANSPAAMHEAKRLVWDVWGRPLDHGLMEETARRYAKARFGEEGREGLNALVDGRSPAWAQT